MSNDDAIGQTTADPVFESNKPQDLLEEKLEYAIEYAQTKRRRFARSAIAVRVLAVVMTGSATVLLGLAERSLLVGVALALTALVTLLNTVEPFFNFRSRWVIMEEGLGQFHRVREDLEYLAARAPTGEVDPEALDSIHDQYQEIWRGMSSKWIEERHSDTGSVRD